MSGIIYICEKDVYYIKYNKYVYCIKNYINCFYYRSDTFDSERIKRATQLFMGTKDFRTFCSKSISNRSINYVRNLNSLTIEKGYPLMPNDPLSQNFEYWNIICSAKGFLYKQV